MNRLGILSGAMALLFVISCGESKTNVSGVEFSDGKALVAGKPFTGEVWSDDGSTYRMDAAEGEIVSLTLYHPNGNIAFSKPAHADSALFYDEQGTRLPLDSFATRYEELAKQIPQLLKRIKGDQ